MRACRLVLVSLRACLFSFLRFREDDTSPTSKKSDDELTASRPRIRRVFFVCECVHAFRTRFSPAAYDRFVSWLSSLDGNVRKTKDKTRGRGTKTACMICVGSIGVECSLAFLFFSVVLCLCSLAVPHIPCAFKQ